MNKALSIGSLTMALLLIAFSPKPAQAAYHTILMIEQKDGDSTRRLETRANTTAGLIELHDSSAISACFIGEAGNVVSIIKRMTKNTIESTGASVRFRALWSEKQGDVFILRVKAEVHDSSGPWTVDTTLAPCRN